MSAPVSFRVPGFSWLAPLRLAFVVSWRCRSRLRLANRGLRDGVGELVAAHEREDRREGEQRDRAEHPERLLEAAGERRGHGVARVKQRLGVAGGHARGDRDPDRPAELLEVFSSPDASPAWCSVTPASAAIEIGMNANAVPAPATMNGPSEVAEEMPMDRHLGRPDDARADQRHPDRHDDLRSAAGDQRLREAGERDRGQRCGQPRELRSAARCSAAPPACTGCRRR